MIYATHQLPTSIIISCIMYHVAPDSFRSDIFNSSYMERLLNFRTVLNTFLLYPIIHSLIKYIQWMCSFNGLSEHLNIMYAVYSMHRNTQIQTPNTHQNAFAIYTVYKTMHPHFKLLNISVLFGSDNTTS